MKSKIKSLVRKENQIYVSFEKDNQIIKNIEKAFQKLSPNFELSNYKKKYGDKILENFWELDKKITNFNFTLISKKDFIKLKIKADQDFLKRFLKIIEEHTEFSELLPRLKAKNETNNQNN